MRSVQIFVASPETETSSKVPQKIPAMTKAKERLSSERESSLWRPPFEKAEMISGKFLSKNFSQSLQ